MLPSSSTNGNAVVSYRGPTNGGGSSAASGELHVTVLSVYDLAVREPPSYVSITVGTQTVHTGPPAQRHKDRNSFKFLVNGNAHGKGNEVSVAAPLPVLYSRKATVEVVYANGAAATLAAEYELRQLKIHETTWLILQLSDGSAAAAQRDEDEVSPTIRLEFTLRGPYRAEIGTIVSAFRMWFSVVDAVESRFKAVVGAAASPFHFLAGADPKLLLLPSVPAAAAVLVSAPIAAGVLLVTLPVAAPVLAAAGALLLAAGCALCGLYASTAEGRARVGPALSPVAHTVLSTPTGQAVVYETGPRPSPVALARTVLPADAWGRLFISLLIDAVGSSSYLLPGVGEAFDVGWAPVQTILIMAMYDESTPNLKYVSFIEVREKKNGMVDERVILFDGEKCGKCECFSSFFSRTLSTLSGNPAVHRHRSFGHDRLVGPVWRTVALGKQ
jgi:hypothetical protein